MPTELERLAERLGHSLQPSIPAPWRFALVIHDPTDGDVACAADGDPGQAANTLQCAADQVATLAHSEPKARGKGRPQ